MKIVSRSLLFSGIVGLYALSALVQAQAYPGQHYAKQAHISLAQARIIALKAFPGTIIKEELEKEKGGSGLRYSFDIRHEKLIHEVGVDANTGKVLENSDDSTDSD
ncbi:MAG: PepSY domain-containing protein [Gammaproteobacteria bacterium]